MPRPRTKRAAKRCHLLLTHAILLQQGLESQCGAGGRAKGREEGGKAEEEPGGDRARTHQMQVRAEMRAVTKIVPRRPSLRARVEASVPVLSRCRRARKEPRGAEQARGRTCD